MFPVGFIRVVGQPCFPRVRGDVPDILMDIAEPQVFSPRARGCSEFRKSLYGDSLVFPACAGMFLDTKTNDAGHRSFPRVRGDVPLLVEGVQSQAVFSPRARGCSAIADLVVAVAPRFPRVRGDVPRVRPPHD